MIQITPEETANLKNKWELAGMARKQAGQDSELFKQMFAEYQEEMIILGRKYNYDPDYATVHWDGVVTIAKRPFM